MELDSGASRHASDLSVIETDLATITASMQATSSFADELRQAYGAAQRSTSSAAARVRDRETLLRRLLPLRGQYAEDEKKLVFYEEAKSLFDPLRITVCPSCLQKLDSPASIDEGTCSLCGRAVAAGEGPIDVASELNSVRGRLREIERYITEVEAGAAVARQEHAQASAARVEIQTRLDAAVAETLAPFVAQRDDLLRQREVLISQTREVRRLLRLHDGLDGRRTELLRLDESIVALRERAKELESHRPSRETVVGDLSKRFASILTNFTFPKLFDPVPPYLDKNFVPHVRGVSYRDIGSTGGLTLISLAWFLALFELAVETGAAHPGFLLIDSPQKNLTPRPDSNRDDDFADPAIVARVWGHLLSMSLSAAPGTLQMVIVDNAPPPAAAGDVVVRYGGPLGPPPYGLIENEIG
jgi:hypothetical protein